MSTVFGIAASALPPDGSALLSAMISPGSEERTSRAAVPGAAFGALAPARVAVSPDGTLLAVLSGRITNCTDLSRKRKLPEADGTALLFDLYGDGNSPAWEQLEGNYAFALWDGKRKRLTLGTDAVASRPLCWCRYGEGIAFASCVKALTALPGTPREYDVAALRYYLSMQYLPVGRSVYAHVRKVLPGSVLIFDGESGRITERKLEARAPASPPSDLTFAEAAERLRALVTASVERALACAPDDRPAGVLLSGGIDSAVMAGLAAKAAGARGICAFTIGTEDPRYDEREAARRVIRHIRAQGGTAEHHEFLFGPGDLERLRARTAAWGEPYADSSLLPTAKLLEETSAYAGTLLGGDGGDELFCGYDRYRAMLFSAKLEERGNWLRPLIRAGAKCLPDGGDRSVSGRLRRLGIFLGEGADRRYFALLDRCPGALAETLLGERFLETPDPFAVLEGKETSADPVERAALWDLANYVPGDTCVKTAVAAMGTGVTHLTPLLDPSVICFAHSLPLQYRMNAKAGKRILKAAFSDLIPAEHLRAPKRGFGAPVADYLRGSWRDDAGSALFDSPLVPGGWLRRKGLERLWAEHGSGARDHSYFLWGAIVLAWFLEAERQN